MKNKIGNICMILGTVLVGLALSLFLYNRWDSERAGRASDEVLEILETAGTAGSNSSGESAQEEENVFMDAETPLKVVQIDGYGYIGTISIPAAGLELPVMKDWSYAGLKIALCRYSGSPYSDDMVIAGHNYRKHFSPIKWLQPGDEVNFTDMEDHVWNYEVAEIETLEPTDIEKMTVSSEMNDWDLTLFTCTQSGKLRCAVRCVRIDKE